MYFCFVVVVVVVVVVAVLFYEIDLSPWVLTESLNKKKLDTFARTCYLIILGSTYKEQPAIGTRKYCSVLFAQNKQSCMPKSVLKV